MRCRRKRGLAAVSAPALAECEYRPQRRKSRLAVMDRPVGRSAGMRQDATALLAHWQRQRMKHPAFQSFFWSGTIPPDPRRLLRVTAKCTFRRGATRCSAYPSRGLCRDSQGTQLVEQRSAELSGRPGLRHRSGVSGGSSRRLNRWRCAAVCRSPANRLRPDTPSLTAHFAAKRHDRRAQLSSTSYVEGWPLADASAHAPNRLTRRARP